MDKKTWLQKLESMEHEQQEVEAPEPEQSSLREALEGRGKLLLLGGVGVFVLIILVIIASSGGESPSERDLQDILARLEVMETKLVGLENQESGRQQALVRMQGDFSILTMRVDKLSREMKEQFAGTSADQSPPRQAAAQAPSPAPQPAPRQPAASTPAPAQTAPAPAVQPSPPAPTPQRVPASRPVTHEVQSGETLYRISRTYGVSVDDLRRLNNITGDRINPGQELTVRP